MVKIAASNFTNAITLTYSERLAHCREFSIYTREQSVKVESHNMTEFRLTDRSRLSAAFHKQAAEIDLTLCCVGELNTTVRGGIHWPVIYGIGLNVKTGEIFPATFPDKGPEQPLRGARQLTGGQQVRACVRARERCPHSGRGG